jgi:lipopolysaccharide transport system ATP-binding protein
MSNVAISVEGLGKRYRIGTGPKEPYGSLRDSIARGVKASFRRRLHSDGRTAGTAVRDYWALKDVSFEVKQGEAVGIIGRNGAGKSTLLKLLSRITEPSTGQAVVHGRVGSLLEVGTGFHPELTGRENIYLSGAVMGISRADIARRFEEIVDFSGVEAYLDTPVKRYSSGMYMRLAFAVAAHLEPDVLVVDEVLAVGDSEFQKKCLGRMSKVSRDGRTVLFVSHNLGAMQQLCSQGLLLHQGEVAFQGSAADAIAAYSQRLHGKHEELDLDTFRHENQGFNPTKCFVHSPEGEAVHSIYFTTPVTVVVEYEILKPLRGAQIAIEIWSHQFGCILCSTNLDIPTGSNGNYEEGRYRATCTLPQLLRPGQYWIELASSIPGMQILFQPTIAWDFEVIDDGSPIALLAQGRLGAVLPVVKWDQERI